jgi:hypothetical protein
MSIAAPVQTFGNGIGWRFLEQIGAIERPRKRRQRFEIVSPSGG